MDKTLELAKQIWPEVSERTNIIPARHAVLYVPILKPPRWHHDDRLPIDTAEDVSTITLRLKKWSNGLIADYNPSLDVLYVKGDTNGQNA